MSLKNDDEYDRDDDSFHNLPAIVTTELDRREADPSIRERASDEVLTALRGFFLNGGKPYISGSFISLMEGLGATPSSKDFLVKDLQYNRWHHSMGGDRQTPEERREVQEAHQGEVRLLRYGEFIEAQERAGLGFPSDCWSFHDEQPYPLKADSDEPSIESKLEHEDDLPYDQLIPLGKSFVWGFYAYANHDKVYRGLAEGTQRALTVQGMPPDARTFEFDISLGTLQDQFYELRNRYLEQCRPLGPAAKLQDKTHASEIKKYVDVLLETLEKIAKPTAATATVFSCAAKMLSAAVSADMDVGRALIQTQAVLRLRAMAIEYAMEVDADMEGRPLWAASAWWEAYITLTELLGDSIVQLRLGSTRSKIVAFRPFDGAETVTPDIVEAAKFFQDHVKAALLVSAESAIATERYSALRQLGHIVCALPYEIAMRFVKDKRIWKLIEDACTMEPQLGETLNERQVKREDNYAPPAAAEATGIFVELSQLGMTIDNSMEAKTQVAPSRLTHEMIQKGIVPLLMDLAQSANVGVSVEALSGLAQISRVKDCRLLMMQHPSGAQLVRDLLASSNGDKVSQAMLLVVHLLWDEEWRGPLLAFNSPPIEETAIRWAAFCMKVIRDKAYEMRDQEKTEHESWLEKMIEKFRTEEGHLRTEQIDLEMEEHKNKWKNAAKWTQLETDRFRSLSVHSALCRSLLLLLTMHHPERIMRVNALHLAACCIDIPTQDHHGAAAALLANSMGITGRTITPGMVPDPEHVVYSLLNRFGRLVDSSAVDQRAHIFLNLIIRFWNDALWKPYFHGLAARDEVCRLHIEYLSRRFQFGGSAAGEGVRSAQSDSTPRPGVHSTCAELTGRLKQCYGCGKLEGKKGEFKYCVRCHTAVYCGRDCQRSHWRKHKKECASMAAARTG